MQSNVNYALVGLFVIVLGSALLGVVFWLTLGGDTRVYDRYRVYFRESVAGLNPKATVRYRGVQVGQVESIGLDPRNPDRVGVVLDIERGTPIRRDTIATLSTRGLTGVASVELSGSSGATAPLEPQSGEDLPVIEAGPSLVARLDDAFNSILTNFDSLSKRLERLLGDDNQKALTETLQHLSTLSGALAARGDSIGRSLGHVETFTATLAGRAERLGRALDQLAAALEGSGDLGVQAQLTLREFRASAQSVRKVADQFDRTGAAFTALAEDGRRELQRLDQNTLPELDATLMQARDLLAVLQRLSLLLEQNPRALLLGKPRGRPGPGEEP